MRVAIYTRISTDEEHQPYSLEAQDTRLGAYIASQSGVNRFEDRALECLGLPARTEARIPARCSIGQSEGQLARR
jgi:hypothetical protein